MDNKKDEVEDEILEDEDVEEEEDDYEIILDSSKLPSNSQSATNNDINK